MSLLSLLLWWRKLRNFHRFDDPVEFLFLHLPDGDFATLGFHTQYVLDGTPSSSSTSDDKDTPGPLQIKKIGYSGDDCRELNRIPNP